MCTYDLYRLLGRHSQFNQGKRQFRTVHLDGSQPSPVKCALLRFRGTLDLKFLSAAFTLTSVTFFARAITALTQWNIDDIPPLNEVFSRKNKRFQVFTRESERCELGFCLFPSSYLAIRADGRMGDRVRPFTPLELDNLIDSTLGRDISRNSP
jgi:hypothetical protein